MGPTGERRVGQGKRWEVRSVKQERGGERRVKRGKR